MLNNPQNSRLASPATPLSSSSSPVRKVIIVDLNLNKSDGLVSRGGASAGAKVVATTFGPIPTTFIPTGATDASIGASSPPEGPSHPPPTPPVARSSFCPSPSLTVGSIGGPASGDILIPVEDDRGNPKFVHRDRNHSYNMSDMARGTGLSLSMISRIFSGDRGLSMNAARRMSRYLKMSIDEVVELVENWSG